MQTIEKSLKEILSAPVEDWGRIVNQSVSEASIEEIEAVCDHMIAALEKEMSAKVVAEKVNDDLEPALVQKVVVAPVVKTVDRVKKPEIEVITAIETTSEAAERVEKPALVAGRVTVRPEGVKVLPKETGLAELEDEDAKESKIVDKAMPYLLLVAVSALSGFVYSAVSTYAAVAAVFVVWLLSGVVMNPLGNRKAAEIFVSTAFAGMPVGVIATANLALEGNGALQSIAPVLVTASIALAGTFTFIKYRVNEARR